MIFHPACKNAGELFSSPCAEFTARMEPDEMTYRGTVKGNIIVLDAQANLPDGTEVEIEIVRSEGTPTSVTGLVAEKGSFADTFREFIGCMDDLPEDFAENHDHYIHGTEKRVP